MCEDKLPMMSLTLMTTIFPAVALSRSHLSAVVVFQRSRRSQTPREKISANDASFKDFDRVNAIPLKHS